MLKILYYYFKYKTDKQLTSSSQHETPGGVNPTFSGFCRLSQAQPSQIGPEVGDTGTKWDFLRSVFSTLYVRVENCYKNDIHYCYYYILARRAKMY